MNHRLPTLIGSLTLLAAGSSDKAETPSARIDTLPGGIVRTVSEAPTGWTDTASAWKLVLEQEIQPAVIKPPSTSQVRPREPAG